MPDDTLATRIAALNDHVGRRLPASVAAGHASYAETLAGMEFPDLPGVGDVAPGFSLPNATGRTISLADVLEPGPAVVTFYRGAWCPYCNLHLRTYQALLPSIRAAGANLIAISPQTPDASLTTAEKNGLDFEVLSDAGNEVAERYGVAFQVDERAVDEILRPRGVDLEAANGDASWRLPAPATFVIGSDRRVLLAFADGNFRRRLEPAAILEALGAAAPPAAAGDEELEEEARRSMDVSLQARGLPT